MSNQFEDEELDIEQIEEIMKKQEDKLYKLALQREKECMQILNKDCHEKIQIYNVPIKIQQTKQQKSQNKILKKCSSNSLNDQSDEIQKKNKNDINEQITEFDLGWIHTYQCGVEEGPVIIFIHGYNNTSMSFYKALKFMSSKYKIFCIDILGMGLSYRPKVNIDNPQQQINYLVESIQQWRIQMNLQNENIFVSGHCFGGYIACQYALKYSQYIQKLILINPMGMTNFTQEELDKISEKLKENKSYFQKKVMNYGQKLFEKKQTPNSLSKKFYFPSNYLLKKFFNQNLNFEKQQSDSYQKFMKRVMQLPESTEIFINTLFRMPNLSAILPLEDIIPFKIIKNNSSKFMFYTSSQSNFSGFLEEQKQSSTESSRSQNCQSNKNLNEQQLNILQQEQQQDLSPSSNQQNSPIQILSSTKKEIQTNYKQQQTPVKSVSDKILQTMENQSQLSKRSSQKFSNLKKLKKSTQFQFQIDCYFGTDEQMISDPKGWKEIVEQNPNIGKIEYLEGGHVSILENYDLYFQILKYL